MPATVVTFYSYKGGVGRSFTLANVATILAEWGYRVLAVDFDIEAPGLNHYFSPWTESSTGGVLDFLNDCRVRKPKPWDAYVTEVALPNAAGTLHLMPAAAKGLDYTALVQALDWDTLYDECALGAELETLRAAWVEAFDLVLIDSRTGVTDFSGLTTVQLPDILAFMFTANKQSLDGCADIARRAMAARRHLPLDRPALLPLPIPARFDLSEEYDRAQLWRKRFVEVLAPFLETWLPLGWDPQKLIDLVTLPYVARWTFGEDVAPMLEPTPPQGPRTTGQAMSYACETIAALLARHLTEIPLLLTSRDEYVLAARGEGRSRISGPARTLRVFVSQPNTQEADAVLDLIERRLSAEPDRGIEFCRPISTPVGSEWSSALESMIEGSGAMLCVVDHRFHLSKAQGFEISQFLRLDARSSAPEESRALIPIVLPNAGHAYENSRLASHRAYFVDAEDPATLEPVIQRLLLVAERQRAAAAPAAMQPQWLYNAVDFQEPDQAPEA